MDIVQEYTYKAGIERAAIIDKTLWAILKTRRPKTYTILNTLRWRWLWKLAGIRVNTRYQADAYAEYEVFQNADLLATFQLKQDIQIR
jgi:hypothetical protein